MSKKSRGQAEGGGEMTEEEAAAAREAERLEALREAEERRKERHRQREEEREKMRQSIRDKYGIKKKEEPKVSTPIRTGSSVNRRKKTPAEIAAETEEPNEITHWKDLGSQLSELHQKAAESKCMIQ